MEFVLWSTAHHAWWRPNGWGYCDTLTEAGLFDQGDPVIARAERGELNSVAIPAASMLGAADLLVRRLERTR